MPNKRVCRKCVEPERENYEWGPGMDDSVLYNEGNNFCPLVILANPEWAETGGPIVIGPDGLPIPEDHPWPPPGCKHCHELKR